MYCFPGTGKLKTPGQLKKDYNAAPYKEERKFARLMPFPAVFRSITAHEACEVDASDPHTSLSFCHASASSQTILARLFLGRAKEHKTTEHHYGVMVSSIRADVTEGSPVFEGKSMYPQSSLCLRPNALTFQRCKETFCQMVCPRGQNNEQKVVIIRER